MIVIRSSPCLSSPFSFICRPDVLFQSSHVYKKSQWNCRLTGCQIWSLAWMLVVKSLQFQVFFIYKKNVWDKKNNSFMVENFTLHETWQNTGYEWMSCEKGLLKNRFWNLALCLTKLGKRMWFECDAVFLGEENCIMRQKQLVRGWRNWARRFIEFSFPFMGHAHRVVATWKSPASGPWWLL